MYYVYEHLRKDTNAIFYVGKGTGDRATRKANRNKYWNRIVNKAKGYKINYIATDIEDEELAYLIECERIDQLKRRGVKLTNLTPGGEGASGGKDHHMWGKEHPQRGSKRPYGNYVKGKDHPMWKQPGPMRGISKPKGKDSPLFGRKRPDGGGKKPHAVIRIDVDGNEKFYESIATAARDLGKTRGGITQCCLHKAKTAHGYKWKYAQENI